jgi:HSP20 family protein
MPRRDMLTELLFEDPPGHEGCPWRPHADVYRTPEGWIVKFDLAGVRPEDVTVALSGNGLTVSGTRRDWLVQQGWDHLQMEIAYHAFERRLRLPCEPGSCRVTTEFRDGFLLVHVGSLEEPGGRR